MKQQPYSLVIRCSFIITFTWVLLIVIADLSSASSPEQASPPDKAHPGQAVKYNRLINESSPYLQQHATNPVDWYPWGTEAFKKAKDEDKPVFLSIPSGNSVALFNLLRLSRITANKDYSAKAEKIVKAFSADIKGYPAGHAQFMVGLNFALHPSYEIVIVGQSNSSDTLKMLAALQNTYLPNAVLIFIPTDDKIAASEIIGLAPFTRTMKMLNNRSTAYVCQEFICKLPTNNVNQMLANLDEMAASSVPE